MRDKQPKDIQGFEYDWLGCDSDGHVGFFSTAGGGYAPNELIEDTDSYDNAIDAILAAPATTMARFAPSLAAGHRNTWRLMAERGLFAYDSDPHGGPYRLVAAPDVPVSVATLPKNVVGVIRRVFFHDLRFVDLHEVRGERLAQR
jgi:hypothetical protein